jgi:hypothetical protein
MLESLRPELRGRVWGASPHSLRERIWRLPRLLHPLDPAIQAVRVCLGVVFCDDVATSLML